MYVCFLSHSVTTGEEDETTVYSSRVKLYSMAKDQSWKERGTGALKLNYQERSKAARLGTFSCTNDFSDAF